MTRVLSLALILACFTVVTIDVVYASQSTRALQEYVNSLVNGLNKQEAELDQLARVVQDHIVVSERRFTILETHNEMDIWYQRLIVASIIGILLNQLATFRKLRTTSKG